MKSEHDVDDTRVARVAIVTGGADGIGWACAMRLAAGGYRVAIADLHGERATERAVALGPEHIGLRADVASEDDVAALMRAVVGRCGRIDVLVNNAGIGEQNALRRASATGLATKHDHGDVRAHAAHQRCRAPGPKETYDENPNEYARRAVVH
ncbi:SDR family NAD(P)-dependent oxidoreductase [Burkholderia ambifaria]|uniref:SDR family NAD(P)-dependent oxidoreductase n=1 Tax=Burkholderia ambifaria TaxID=152480 RepID=UPI002FDFBB9B